METFTFSRHEFLLPWTSACIRNPLSPPFESPPSSTVKKPQMRAPSENKHKVQWVFFNYLGLQLQCQNKYKKEKKKKKLCYEEIQSKRTRESKGRGKKTTRERGSALLLWRNPRAENTGRGENNAKNTRTKNALLGRIPRAETAGSWVKNQKNTRTKIQPPLTEERAGGKQKQMGTKIKPAENEEE